MKTSSNKKCNDWRQFVPFRTPVRLGKVVLYCSGHHKMLTVLPSYIKTFIRLLPDDCITPEAIKGAD